MRRAPSATAPTANGAAPEPEVLEQELAEDIASAEATAASETIEAVTEAAPEKPEAALLETVSPVALEAAAPAEPEAAPEPEAASEPQAEDAPAEEPEAPEPVAAAEPEPEPAVEEPAPVAEAVEAAAEPAEAPAPAVAAPQAPKAKAASSFACRFNFTPTYLDVEGIGTILMNYVQNESAAALSHMRALGEVRSPADVIRLNVTEMQRAADASLTCWIAVARRASRSMAAH